MNGSYDLCKAGREQFSYKHPERTSHHIAAPCGERYFSLLVRSDLQPFLYKKDYGTEQGIQIGRQ